MITRLKVWVCYDPKTNEKIAQYAMSIRDLCNELGYNSAGFSNAIYQNRTYKGYIWKKEIITKDIEL